MLELINVAMTRTQAAVTGVITKCDPLPLKALDCGIRRRIVDEIACGSGLSWKEEKENPALPKEG
jgi:hypothetical protein